MQILKIVKVGQDPTGAGVVLQVIKDPVHLIEHALLVLMLDAHLIAIGLADGAGFIGPGVPYMAVQIVNV